MKDIDRFINTVAEMRVCQKNFFTMRSALYLRQAKQLERRVDRMLEEHYAARRQPKLDFDSQTPKTKKQ